MVESFQVNIQHIFHCCVFTPKFRAGHDSAGVLGNDELRLALCFLFCGTGRAESRSLCWPQDVVSHAKQCFVSASLEMTSGL